MKILIVCQYFWPESFRVNDFALGLKEKGHQVTVFTGKPNYPKGKFYKGYGFFKKNTETWNEIEILRSNLIPRSSGSGLRLMLNYLSFIFFASLNALFHRSKYDLIFVYQLSPVTMAIPAIILSRKNNIPMYMWVQDLWPDSINAAGQINNKYVLKALNNLTKWIYKKSELLLIQSEGFRQHILNQGVKNSKIVYFPNSTESLYKVMSPSKTIEKKMPDVEFSILFAGNIGEAQDFDNIIETARILKAKSNNIHFIILGNGRKKEFVTNKVKEYKLENTFHLLGSFPVEDMPHFFACADALLVALKDKKIFSLTIPSKVQSYLACGKPIIGGLSGEGAKIINKSESGFTSVPGDSIKMAENILTLYNMAKSQRVKMGKNARKYFEENFEREKLLDQFIRLIETNQQRN